jgi:nucleoid DNA-binding protein
MKAHSKKYKELAEKYNLPVEVIEKICDSQFEFTKSIISNGKDEQVRLQNLGLFQVKSGARNMVAKRTERLKKLRDEKDSRQKE